MPIADIPLANLDEATEDFIFFFEDDIGITTGTEDPHPDEHSCYCRFGWRLKHDIIRDFWDQSQDEYLNSVRIYPELKIVVYDYIRIKKSLDWERKERVIEILYHEFIEQRFPDTVGELFPHLDVKPRNSHFSRV